MLLYIVWKLQQPPGLTSHGSKISFFIFPSQKGLILWRCRHYYDVAIWVDFFIFTTDFPFPYCFTMYIANCRKQPQCKLLIQTKKGNTANLTTSTYIHTIVKYLAIMNLVELFTFLLCLSWYFLHFWHFQCLFQPLTLSRVEKNIEMSQMSKNLNKHSEK